MPATLADIQRKYGKSVYPLYKDQMYEPFMEHENGIAYLGVVLHDTAKDLVQCSICAQWVKGVYRHIKNFKNGEHLKFKDLNTYRTEFGIFKKSPLCSKETSLKHSQSALKNKTFLHLQSLGTNMNRRRNLKQLVENKIAHQKVAYKNIFNTCDAQIIARIEKVKKIVGREVRDNDLRKYDPNLGKIFRYRYKTANEGLRKFGYNPPSTEGEYRIPTTSLISNLRLFVIENKKMPTVRAFEEFTNQDYRVYQTRFGSWHRAKMMAGLDQLLEEVKFDKDTKL